jgi:hypothetical protein
MCRWLQQQTLLHQEMHGVLNCKVLRDLHEMGESPRA